MLFKRIHRTALRGSQGVLTGSTGMLTLQSAQNGSESLSGALQSRSRHLRRSQDHRWPWLTSCARMESRSSNMGHTGTQDVLRGILQPFRCQHTTERSGAAQDALTALQLADPGRSYGAEPDPFEPLISATARKWRFYRKFLKALCKAPERLLSAL